MTSFYLHPDAFVDDNKAAEILGLSRSYLRQKRCTGGGPAFAYMGANGRGVRYQVADLMAWASARKVTSTAMSPAFHGEAA